VSAWAAATGLDSGEPRSRRKIPSTTRANTATNWLCQFCKDDKDDKDKGDVTTTTTVGAG
jgi:hypothetical protein